MTDTEEFVPTELRDAWRDEPESFVVVSKSPTDEEEDFLKASRELANTKHAFSTAVLRRIANGQRSYDAQHGAQVDLGRDLALAEANYEIALNHLRKS